MSKMILCEKPSQARDISNVFNYSQKKDGYIEVEDSILGGKAYIVWAVGHIVELKMPHEYDEKYKNFNSYPILLKNDEFQFKVSEDKKDVFNNIKKVFNGKNINEIIIATDSAREGENIAYKIINQLNANNDTKIKRLWISSYTDESIKKGFENLYPASKTYNYYIEARTREISDWLVGINLSRHFTKVSRELGNDSVIHIGRVSSPTLNLINIRENNIKNFKETKYYKVAGTVIKNEIEIKSELKNKFDNEDQLHEFLFDNNITDLTQKGIVKEVLKEQKYSLPPKFYDLTSLQEDMNDKFKYSAKETLNIAQSLYEKKLISYPRTDSRYITVNEESHLKNLKSYIEKKVNQEINENITNKSLINENKVEDHYAILITGNDVDDYKLDDKEINVYNSILKNVAMNFMDKQEYEVTTVSIDVSKLEFIFTGKVIIKNGFKALDVKESKDDVIPSFTKDEVVEVNLDILEKFTSAPKRYTEKTLLKAMSNPIEALEDEGLKSTLQETKGLGTPATRADIIENLKNNKYIQIQKNKIYITKNGILLCKLLNNHLLSKADMTGLWENFLNEIGKGTKEDTTFVETVNKMITKTINTPVDNISEIKNVISQKQESNNICKCPKCKEGYITKKKSIYGCTNYRNGCDFVIQRKILDKTITENTVKQLCTDMKSKEIKGFKSKKSGKEFSVALKLDNEFKVQFDFPKK